MIKNATGEIANKIQSVGMSLTECQNIVKIPKINATVESKRMPENESLERFEPYPKTFLRNIKKTKTIAPTAANESYKKGLNGQYIYTIMLALGGSKLCSNMCLIICLAKYYSLIPELLPVSCPCLNHMLTVPILQFTDSIDL
jgi:hypothetical protein